MHTKHRSAVLALVVTMTATAAVGAATSRPAAATVTSNLVQVNGPSNTISLVAPGDSSVLTFQGIVGQVLTFSATGGTFAGNCDATLTLRNPSGVTIGAPTCVGTAGSLVAPSLTANGLYRATVDATGASVGSLQLQIVSTAAKLSITPNAPELGVVVAAGATVNLGFSAGPGTYVAATGRDAADCLTSFRVVRPDGVDQFAATCAAGGSGTFVDQSAVTTTGTYKLRLVNSATVARTVFVQAFSGVNVNATATIDGPTQTIALLPAQQAHVTFPVTAGQSFGVVITNPTLSVTNALCAQLFKPDGTPFGSNCGIARPTGITAPTIPDTLADTSGNWSVLIDAQGLFAPTISVGLVTVADPTVLAVDGIARTRVLSPDRDPLDLHFTAPRGRTVKIEFTSLAVLAGGRCIFDDALADLVDPSGLLFAAGVLSSSACSSSVRSHTVTLPSDGVWTLRIHENAVRSMSIRLVSLLLDIDQTTSGLRPVVLSANEPDQSVGIRFTAIANHTYVLNRSLSCYTVFGLSLCPVFTLTDPHGATLLTTDAHFTALGQTLFTATESGVFEYRGTPDTVTHVLSGSVEVADITTITSPTSLGVASASVPTRFGQDVAFTFSATAGAKVALKVLNLPSVNAALTFVRPDGTVFGAARNIYSGAFLDPVRLDTSGTWSVLVNQPLGQPSGSVQVRLDAVTDIKASVSVGALPKPFTITAAGQVARFTLLLQSGRTFRVHFSGSTFSGAAVSVATPTGVTTPLCTLNAGTLDCPVTTTTIAGTYTVIVNPPGERVGSASINVTTT